MPPRVKSRAEHRFWRNFSRSVRRARERRGMSKEALARAVGYDHTSILNIEAGRQRPTLFMVVSIAKELKVPLQNLVPR